MCFQIRSKKSCYQTPGLVVGIPCQLNLEECSIISWGGDQRRKSWIEYRILIKCGVEMSPIIIGMYIIIL